MENKLIPFQSDEFGELRTMEIDGEPWFVGKDVCAALGYQNSSKALTDHVDNEDKLNNESLSSLGQRGGWLINESGLYSLVMSSKLETAKKFKKWVTSEVLPSIRKHGAYITAPVLERAIADPDTMIGLLQELKKEQETRKQLAEQNLKLEEHKKALESKIEEDKPKVIFADAVTASDDTILVGELAKLISQNGVEIGEKRLFHWMRDHGYIMKRSKDNVPTQKSMELGIMKIKETSIMQPGMKPKVRKTPLVTGRGQKYFMKFFIEEKVDNQQISML